MNHAHAKEMLEVKNYLRNHPEEVKIYSDLKNRLYEKYSNDYAKYRKEKDLYMAKLIKRTREDTS